jgi:TRAP-type transport system small permease protein
MTIHSLASGLARVVEVGIGLILSVILVLAMGEIVSRYLTGHSLVWVDELSRLLFVWLTFLAAAAAFHHRIHFRVVLLWRAMSQRVRQRLEVIVDFISLCFAIVLLTQSLHIIDLTHVQRTTALQIPMSYVYSVVPLAALLIMVFILLRWAEAAQTRQLPDPAGASHS